MPSRFQLRGHSLEALRWQLFDTYGHRARIIRAERIQTGGLFGLGATTSFEVTVEVDGGPASNKPAHTRRRAAGPRPDARRRGLAELLADADDADSAGPGGPVRRTQVSTEKPGFDAILGRLTERIGTSLELSPAGSVEGPEPAPARPAVPRLAAAAGDLVVLVGLRDQPLRTAWSMAGALDGQAELRTSGNVRSNGVGHVLIDSAEVQKVQALAAVDGKPLLIAFSIGARGASSPQALSSLRPNQLWLVVDAAHKPEDTEAWVRQAAWHASPDALAVVGSTETATPETVNALGYPVGWVDGYPATSPEL
ncbi:hypothetical protein [Arthrobacter sp. STN4]|uniref:hypothetical protein n=1 Tax=Arthrobacter sp. STN4 TaxID=2923276 RepID=UPI00211A8D70|nr:hypothetical protein [Arthrobacter sp. STN4]MCQ9162520.1 hypothetical protein [Arthrobacter sp. STN4]